MLTTVTVSGADDKTSVTDLLRLSQRYPFVEWAIHYSPSKIGEPRFPDGRWRSEFMDAVRGRAVRRAMHLSGPAVREMMLQGPQKLTYRSGYQRIQLNFDASMFTTSDIKKLAKKSGWAEFWDGSTQGVIVQYNENNEGVPELFAMNGCRDVQVLFDASNGTGLTLERFEPPLSGFDCGYAGGIGPETISSALEKAAAAAGYREYWLSLESHVRTDDCLDLDKVEYVLAKCAAWIEAHRKNTTPSKSP